MDLFDFMTVKFFQLFVIFFGVLFFVIKIQPIDIQTHIQHKEAAFKFHRIDFCQKQQRLLDVVDVSRKLFHQRIVVPVQKFNDRKKYQIIVCFGLNVIFFYQKLYNKIAEQKHFFLFFPQQCDRNLWLNDNAVGCIMDKFYIGFYLPKQQNCLDIFHAGFNLQTFCLFVQLFEIQ